ncbi:hypothetical protein [Paraburkholderia sp. MM5477-R1]|uniref:hypothetical protein n=1 Tax=Paraburkholderia sp. MM5477-R1 TaxID=2991062 RepID=UPI003D1AF6E9
MALSPPNIVGALSPLSTSVRLCNQIVNAAVTVYRNGAAICHQPAVAADQIFDFDPGTTLNPDDSITTSQELNGDASGQTPFPTIVQKLIPPFTGHRFISHVYQCGTSLFLGGIVPGADIQLSSGAAVIGQQTSVDGGAVVKVPSIGVGEIIVANQIVRGVPGPPVSSPPADKPAQLGNVFLEDPMACTTSVKVNSYPDGCQITVQSNEPDPATSRLYDAPIDHMTFGTPPLVAGQTVTVQARMPRCGLESAVLKKQILPANPALPVIATPLCAGAIRMLVTSVRSGTLVTARQGAVTVGTGQASGDTLDMWIDPLADNGVPVTVTADLCGVTRDSQIMPVTSAPETIAPCHIPGPLLDCSMTLWVDNVHPGAVLAAFSDTRGQISEWRTYPGVEAEIALASALEAGQSIHVMQIACGGGMQKSDNDPDPSVAAVVALPMPDIIEPLFADRRVVDVKSGFPGALVQLYTRETGYISSDITGKDGIAHPSADGIDVMIRPGYHAYARQILCNLLTDMGPVVQVIDRTPLAPTIEAPPNNGTNQPQRPTLKWRDPGAGTVHQATQFLVELAPAASGFGGGLIVNQALPNTQYALPINLAFGVSYVWRVTGFVGDPGFEIRGPSTTAQFAVTAKPVIDSVARDVSDKFEVKGKNFLVSHAVHIRVVNSDTLQSDSFPANSDAAGNLDAKLTLPALPAGTHLAFSANDERQDAGDLTGTLWSNTFNLTI